MYGMEDINMIKRYKTTVTLNRIKKAFQHSKQFNIIIVYIKLY